MDNQLPEPLLTPIEPKLSTPNPSWFWPLMIAMGVFVLMFAGFIAWIVSMQKPAATLQQPIVAPANTQPAKTLISGQILFDGYAPSGAKLIISAKQRYKGDFKEIATNLKPDSTVAWNWKNAEEGANYEIQASLVLNGKVLQQSALTVVSAPATNVHIHLVSEQKPKIPQTAIIGGAVDLKGYIAPNSKIIILAKSISAITYATIATMTATADTTTWTWTGATAGTTYDMKAQIQNSSGAVVSNDYPIVVTAPAHSLQLVTTSIATPSSEQTGAISGTIILNGIVPQGSHITLTARKSGTSTYTQVIDNISATTNASWIWNSATVGTLYDIKATLWLNNKELASSQIITTTAPASGEVLTINAQIPIAEPTLTSIQATCNQQQINLVPATITYNVQQNLPSPRQYSIVITAASGKMIVNTALTPTNPTQTQTLITNPVFVPQATYFAQYAYAQCTNCGTFSPLSQPIQFACQ